MGCYRIWARGRHVDVHAVSIGIETTGDSVVIEPEEAKGPPEARLHGFVANVRGIARLVPHDACPKRTDYEEIMEALCGPDQIEGCPHV